MCHLWDRPRTWEDLSVRGMYGGGGPPQRRALRRGGGVVSRSWWRCRNADCPVAHGAVLGQVTAEGGLVLDPAVRSFAAYVDTGRIEVECPACSQRREFRGMGVRSQCW